MRKAVGSLILFLAASILILADQAAGGGQDKMCGVRGKVVDGRGNPQADVEILMQRSREALVSRFKTDGSGIFAFSLPCDSYRVQIRKQGFREAVDVWKLEGGGRINGRSDLPPIVLQDIIDSQSIPLQMTREFQGAVAQMKQGNYRDASQALQELADRSPNDAEINYMLGVCLNQIEKPTEALVVLKRAVDQKPQAAGILYELGLAYHKLNQLQPALNWYQKALELEPDRPEFNFNAALVLTNQNKPEQALECLKKVLLEKPDDAEALEMAGRCYMALMDFSRAQSMLEKALRLARDPARKKDIEILIALIRSKNDSKVK